MNRESDRLTVAEVARELDFSEKIVRGLIDRRELVAYKPFPRGTFVKRKDLDDFIEARMDTPITAGKR